MKRTGSAVILAGMAAAMAIPVFAEEGTGTRAANRTAAVAERRAERAADIKERREAAYSAKRTVVEKQHTERIADLKARLAKIQRLTDEQRNEIVAFFETQYKENMDFWATQHGENMKFIDQLGSDTSTQPNAIHGKIQSHMAAQKAEWEKHRAQQQSERQAEKAKFKPQDNAAPAGN